jgi:hypothetical protein
VLHHAGSAFQYDTNYGAQLITVNSTRMALRFYSTGTSTDAYVGFQVGCWRLQQPVAPVAAGLIAQQN